MCSKLLKLVAWNVDCFELETLLNVEKRGKKCVRHGQSVKSVPSRGES